MQRMSSTLVVLAALSAARPASAFFHEILLQPLQEMKHALHPQPQPQYYQYRRAVYDGPQQGGYAGYGYGSPAPSSPRQLVYQGSQPTTYEVGSAYSYGGSQGLGQGNPLSSFLQGSWLPWKQQYAAPQTTVYAQPQPVQQPGFWGGLPWGGHGGAQQSSSGPVFSFLQNPATLWSHQSVSRPVTYVTPLAPSAPASLSSHHISPAVFTAPAAPSEATVSASIKPVDSVDSMVQEAPEVGDNGIRRLALQHVHQDGLPCA